MNSPFHEYSETIEDTGDNFKRSCYDVPYPHGTLHLGIKTCVMGILNVTPDSFYDGKRYDIHENAVEHAIKMVKDGAEIIDIGGESTRPGAFPIMETEEIKRVIPVIKFLSKQLKTPISIDTYKAKVAERAIGAGASIINDVSGLRRDEKMAQVAAEANVPVILMHKKGTSRTMQKYPLRKNACAEIMAYLKKINCYSNRRRNRGKKNYFGSRHWVWKDGATESGNPEKVRRVQKPGFSFDGWHLPEKNLLAPF